MKKLKEKLNKKLHKNGGFTLMEMLIVVAIIAILIAIAIPTFTSQLESARDAVTVSNLRAAYAEAQTAYLTKDSSGNATYTKSSGVETVAVKNVAAKGTQTGYAGNIDDELPFEAPDVMGGTAGDYTVTFTYDTNGKITNVAATT